MCSFFYTSSRLVENSGAMLPVFKFFNFHFSYAYVFLRLFQENTFFKDNFFFFFSFSVFGSIKISCSKEN